ncbi:FHA domain-containing protein [Myxococcota bacterium]|nr:FHA domain-containing protein [Myxococcota bacterium]MBU1534311.1 FHA domain-containing protein [Myxococcota bacterium]
MATNRRQSSRGRGARSARRGSKGPEGFILSIQDGRHRGEEHHFETEATVGRTDENSIVLIDDSISRNHCRVWGKRGVFLVEDTGSSNGTRLNGKILTEPEVLKDGDYITPGVVNIMFQNLDIDSAGDVTVVVNLTEKQKEKLDIETPDVSVREQFEKVWATPKGKVGVIAVCLLLLLVFYFAVSKLVGSGPKKRRVIPDQSNVITEYRENNWESFLSYNFGHCGYCVPSHNTSAKISFNIPIANTRAVLTYAAGMIEKDKEVEILLNGKRIQYAEWAPPTRPKYNYMIDLYTAAKKNPKIELKTGENILEFRNLYNTPEKLKAGTSPEYWIVFYVRIKTTALPKANIPEAEKNYSNAKQAFDNRELNPSNYKNSLEKFFRVIDLLELAKLDDPSMARFNAMYKDSVRTINILNRELDSFFRNCRATIIEASRFTDEKQKKAAIHKLREELKRFPDTDLRKKKLDLDIKDTLL